MKLTLKAVLAFLRSKGGATARGCWWRQKKMAEEIGVPVRSLQRYLAQLEALGEIRVQHRSSTTNLYFLSGKPVEIKPVLACPHAKMADASIELNKLPLKKPAQPAEHHRRWVEENFPRPQTPEFYRVMEVLRGAQERIRRAREPLAYERAIIAAEMRRTG